MSDLTALLVAAQSADAAVRTQAEAQLNALQQSNYGELLVGLSAELANATKPVDARRLAGLILKNTLDAKEDARKVGRRWRALDAHSITLSRNAVGSWAPCVHPPSRRRAQRPLIGRRAPHPCPHHAPRPAAAAHSPPPAGGAAAPVDLCGCGHEEAGQAEPAGHPGHPGALLRVQAAPLPAHHQLPAAASCRPCAPAVGSAPANRLGRAHGGAAPHPHPAPATPC